RVNLNEYIKTVKLVENYVLSLAKNLMKTACTLVIFGILVSCQNSSDRIVDNTLTHYDYFLAQGKSVELSLRCRAEFNSAAFNKLRQQENTSSNRRKIFEVLSNITANFDWTTLGKYSSYALT